MTILNLVSAVSLSNKKLFVFENTTTPGTKSKILRWETLKKHSAFKKTKKTKKFKFKFNFIKQKTSRKFHTVFLKCYS
jgi:hypothetical protein